MQYRNLGSSGTLVSTLALGTMNFGTDATPEEDAFAQLDAFIDAGGNLIDTADVYNGGIAEATVGRWVAARPADVTDHAVIATKARTRTGADPNEAGTSRRHLDRALTTSLRRLHVDSIDLYQMHAWDPLTPIEETLSFLDAAVRAGKIRYLGLSNHTGWQLQAVVSTARARGYEVPVTLQAQYNLIDPRDRVRDDPVRPLQRPGRSGLVPAGQRLPHRQVRPRPAPPDRHPRRTRQPAVQLHVVELREL